MTTYHRDLLFLLSWEASSSFYLSLNDHTVILRCLYLIIITRTGSSMLFVHSIDKRCQEFLYICHCLNSYNAIFILLDMQNAKHDHEEIIHLVHTDCCLSPANLSKQQFVQALQQKEHLQHFRQTTMYFSDPLTPSTTTIITLQTHLHWNFYN